MGTGGGSLEPGLDPSLARIPRGQGLGGLVVTAELAGGELVVEEEPGATYSVRTTTDLSLPFEDWTVLYNEVASCGFVTRFAPALSPQSPGESRRFFIIQKNEN